MRMLVLCAAAVLAWIGLVASGDASYGTAGNAPYGVSSGDAQHGKRVAEVKCASCHGADGNSTNAQFPKLAGQRQGYLYLQLRAFQTGNRTSAIMGGIAKTLSDAELADVASYYSRQAIRPDSVGNRRLADEGKRIFFAPIGGAAMSCATCHASVGQQGRTGSLPMRGGMMGGGMMGMGGMMANVPNLAGQHATYIVGQLSNFASGRRYGMMMNSIAASLSETNREAVAAYLSSLP